MVFATLLLSSLLATGTPEQQVRATLNDWLDALAKNDLPRVERILADDYRITASAEGKVMDKKEDLEPLHSGKVTFESAEASDVNVRVFGDTAIVTGVAKFVAVVSGKRATFVERFTDVYVKRDGRWQPVASHTTPLKPTPPSS